MGATCTSCGTVNQAGVGSCVVCGMALGSASAWPGPSSLVPEVVYEPGGNRSARTPPPPPKMKPVVGGPTVGPAASDGGEVFPAPSLVPPPRTDRSGWTAAAKAKASPSSGPSAEPSGPAGLSGSAALWIMLAVVLTVIVVAIVLANGASSG